MFFDTKAALAEICSEPPTHAIRATRAIPGELDSTGSTYSIVQGLDPESAAGRNSPPDADLLLAYLHDHGTATYGAFAMDAGIGATRAWRAEAMLVAAGRVRLDTLGRMVVINTGESA